MALHLWLTPVHWMIGGTATSVIALLELRKGCACGCLKQVRALDHQALS